MHNHIILNIALLAIWAVDCKSAVTISAVFSAFNYTGTELSGTPWWAQPTVYGPTAASRVPGARYQHCSASATIAGVFYVYGGYSYKNGNYVYVGDFWQYDIASDIWTLIGENGRNKGTLLQPSSNTWPGVMSTMACSMDMAESGVYLFGGQTYISNTLNLVNDLFRYDVASGFWVWLKGVSNGQSPSVGIYSDSNSPAARSYGTMCGRVSNSTLYLFGGSGYLGSIQDNMNDMWRYNITSNQWTLLSGSVATAQKGQYGQKGTFSTGNFPGGRNGHMMSCTADAIYVMGGNGYSDSLISVDLNDMWHFEPSTLCWSWEAGSSTSTTTQVAPNTGSFSSANTPPGVSYGGMTILPAMSSIALYGGYSSNLGNFLDSLWLYNTAAKQWAYLGSSITPGRAAVSMDPIGNANLGFLVFGGGTSSNGPIINDLWRIDFGIPEPASSTIRSTSGVFPTTTTLKTTTMAIPSSTTSIKVSTTAQTMQASSSSSSQVQTTSQAQSFISQPALTSQKSGTSSLLSSSTTSSSLSTAITFSSSRSVLISQSSSSSTTAIAVVTSTMNPTTTSRTLSTTLSVASSTTIGPSASDSSSTMIASTTSRSQSPPTRDNSSQASTLMSDTVHATTLVLISASTTSLPSTATDVRQVTSAMDSMSSSTGNTIATTDSSSYSSAGGSGRGDDPGNLDDSSQDATSSLLSADLVSTPPANIMPMRDMVIIIGAVVGMLLVAVGVITCIVRRNRQRGQKLSTESEGNLTRISGHDLTEFRVEDFTSRSRATATTMNSTDFTAYGTSTAFGTSTAYMTEFAVPGYLQFDASRDFLINEKLAQGGGGAVHIGTALHSSLRAYGDKIVVKIVGPSKQQVPQVQALAFDQELAVMHYLGRHRNIAVLLGWSDKPLAMLMKAYPSGSLFDWIKGKCVPAKKLKLSFAMDICRGLQFMHRKDVAHCDIKPANVLIDVDASNGTPFAVLTDFGISQMFSTQSQLVHAFEVINMGGFSLPYAAPELIHRCKLGIASVGRAEAVANDVYAVAIVFMDLLQGRNWSR